MPPRLAACSSRWGTAEALPFGRDALDDLLDLAQRGIGDLIALQKQAVGHILK
jgi:ribonuclease PH